MDSAKNLLQHENERLKSRLDILRGAINRFSHIINTDKEHEWKKLKTQTFSRSSRIHVHKRSKGASDIYKIQLDISSKTDRSWSTTSWHALFQSVGTRKLWDQMMDNVQILDRPDSNTLITHRTFKGSKEGCVFAEKIIRKSNMIRHIATTTTPRRENEQDAIACPALAGYDVRISPDGGDDPNLDSRVIFYYEIASSASSEDIIEPYVISLVTGPLSTLALHGAPPDIIREPEGSSIKTISYNADRRVWELTYQILNLTTSTTTEAGMNSGNEDRGGGSEHASPSSAVGSIDIQIPRKGSLASSTIPWQTGSWDRATSPLQLASPLRHRRGSFMGSLLLPPTSQSSSLSHTQGFSKSSSKAFAPSSSQLQQQKQQRKSVMFSSSYTFGRHHSTEKNSELQRRTPHIVIELDTKTWAVGSAVDLQLDVTVAGIGELDSKMVDQFAQLCIRCYAERSIDNHDNDRNRYFLTLYHPPQLVQYLMEGNDTANLAREPTLFGPRDEITVNLQLTPRKKIYQEAIEEQEERSMMDFALYVNGKEWPFRSWMGETLFLDERGSSSSSSDDDHANIDTDDDDHDVFAETMEHEDGIDEGDDKTTAGKLASSIELHPIVVPNSSHSEKTTTITTSVESQHDSSSSVTSLTERYKVGREEDKQDISVSDDGKQIEEKPKLSEEGEAEDIMIVPETDPEPVLEMRNYFNTLIHSDKWHVLQSPDPSNLFVTIQRLEVPGHPTGAYLSESVWKDCSVWDVKAVVSCVGARKIWDSTYEDGIFLHQVSKSCSLWHHKTKGFWTVSARDYVAFSSAYTSASCIDLCSTSCIDDSYDHHTLPVNTPGFVRARLDLWNWRLERLDMKTTSVKLINQANLQGWIPSYVPISLSGHNPDLVMRAHQFFNKHGAPPDLTLLEHGSLINMSYDHHRQSWRCEYTQSTTATSNDEANSASNNTFAEVRIRERPRRGYNVVIDPPPSWVKASTRTHDPYGIWLEINHRESDIIPQRGKILLLIKPGVVEGQDYLLINGDVTAVHKDLVKSMRIKEKQTSLDDTEEEDDGEFPPQVMPQQPPRHQSSSTGTVTETATEIKDNESKQDEKDEKNNSNDIAATIESLPISPETLAQSALTFLTRVSDQQFGWSNVSDKNGLRVSKRSGTAKLTNNSPENIMETFMGPQMEIPEPSVMVKATKVIEGFSLEEVASIVANTGNLRKLYDESVEEMEVVARTQNGCQVVRQLVKGIFPFKSREIFVSSCIAHEKAHFTTNPLAKRILYVEASIPNFPSSSDPSKRPPALFSLSGWILEAIDPYTTTTNHPIPSMRATHLASLDLGSSVPTYMSNLVTNGFPKRMKAIEKLLHTQGPPPYLGQPYAAQAFMSGKLIDDLSVQGPIEWITLVTTYDSDKHVFKCDAKFQLLSSPPKKMTIATPGNVSSKSNLSTSLLKSKQQQQQQQGSSFTGPMTASTSTGTTMSSNSSVVSLPTNSSDAPTGKSGPSSSSHPIRRGSIALTKEQSTATATTTIKGSLTSSSPRTTDTNMILLRAIIDLRNYSKGYEIMVNMKRHSENSEQEKDVSSTLSVNVSELAPEPSHLVANTNCEFIPRKHAVEISATTMVSLIHEKIYALELEVIPVTEECLQNRGTRLTVSGVLGEDDGQWHGIVILNGKEMDVGSTMEVAAPLIEMDSPVLSHVQHHLSQKEAGSSDQLDSDSLQLQTQGHLDVKHQQDSDISQAGETNEEAVSMLGGGVVAAALGGVSASVNQIQDFRVRMLLPFRNSTSFLSGTSVDRNADFESPDSSPSNSSDEGEGKEKLIFSPLTDNDDRQQRQRRRYRSISRYRSTSDVAIKRNSPSSRGGAYSMATVKDDINHHRITGTRINKSGFLVIILLLSLILIVTIRIPAKDEVLGTYLSATHLRQLCKIPWMGGWHIEIIAVHQ
ncbi:hypothetical protein BDC45DRAFT_509320 [Circinella umbellata]|nr:hypothetical protein BDC45DRAFT_509320 [Circinella umbellata]